MSACCYDNNPKNSSCSENIVASLGFCMHAYISSKKRNCGGTYPHKDDMQSCPGKGKTMSQFLGKETFCQVLQIGEKWKKCACGSIQKKFPRRLEFPDSCFKLTGAPGKSPETQISFRQMQVRVLIDSGASVNIVHYNKFKQIQRENNNVIANKSKKMCLNVPVVP